MDQERVLDRLFAQSRINDRSLSQVIADIGAMQARLRGVHLAAHLETRELLTHEQVQRYVELRGYAKTVGNAVGGAGSQQGRH